MTLTAYTLGEHVAAFPNLTLKQRQRLGVELNGTPLNDDGVEGPKTRGAIYVSPHQDHRLLKTAFDMALLGAREDGANNSGYFPHIFMAKKAYDADADRDVFKSVRQGLWCAGFVSWCLWRAYGPRAPFSWSARTITRMWAHGKSGGKTILDVADALPGDVICWRREVPGEDAAGHVGIVIGLFGSLLLVIEGNGGRAGGAVGVYGYDINDKARRGRKDPQDVLLLARRDEQWVA